MQDVAKAPEIHMQGLDVGYDGKAVLTNVNVTLPAGKISVILGGSGCGKSTLLRHMLGLQSPISGEIRIGDFNLGRLQGKEPRRLRQRMGVLFQDGALLGSLTLGENVALPLREHTQLGEELIESVVRLKLGLVGLEPYIDYYPSELSGGMRKRAGLARALVLDPAILLCDEPSAGLDPITAADLDSLILELLDSFNMTIVVVTHDLDSLFNIADYVVVLNEGKVAFTGNLSELRKSPDPYIQQFLSREGFNSVGAKPVAASRDTFCPRCGVRGDK